MAAKFRSKLKVLYLPLEFPKWAHARSWPYPEGIGLEEGFAGNGVRFVSVTFPWVRRFREAYGSRKFDQVWFEARHNVFDDVTLDWIGSLAPVRVAFVGESLSYSDEELAFGRESMADARPKVERALRFATHLLAVDERDAEEVNARRLARAMWWVTTVPRRFVQTPQRPRRMQALFSGAVYGDRQRFLEHPDLKGLIHYHASSETRFRLHHVHALIQAVGDRLVQSSMPLSWGLPLYLFLHRLIRRSCFSLFLTGIRSSVALLNLPSFVKTYASRVVESVAIGCPVISWKIPDRPRTLALFEDGKEILLFPKENPEILAEQIKRLIMDPGLGRQIARRAQRKVVRYHTTEQRVGQLLDWIENGEEPAYD